MCAPLVPMVVDETDRGDRAYDIYSRLLKDNIVFIGASIDDRLGQIRIVQQVGSDCKRCCLPVDRRCCTRFIESCYYRLVDGYRSAWPRSAEHRSRVEDTGN